MLLFFKLFINFLLNQSFSYFYFMFCSHSFRSVNYKKNRRKRFFFVYVLNIPCNNFPFMLNLYILTPLNYSLYLIYTCDVRVNYFVNVDVIIFFVHFYRAIKSAICSLKYVNFTKLGLFNFPLNFYEILLWNEENIQQYLVVLSILNLHY